MPASVTALVTSGKLPSELAASFTPDGELVDDWEGTEIARAVAELLASGVDEGVRGALALAGAYGYLDGLEFLDSTEMIERADRAEELLDVAQAAGIDRDETFELRWCTSRARKVAAAAADMEAYVAEHGTTPRRQLRDKLTRAHDLYEAGDRAAAIALFREVAEAGGDETETTDIGWCRLLHDAAHADGPEAARSIWREARDRRPTFPHPDHSTGLINLILGTGLPDIITVLATERLARAEDEQLPWKLDEEETRILQLALAELDAG